MATNLSTLRVTPGKLISLNKHDTGATLGWDKDEAKAELEKVKVRIDVLQARLAAEEERSVLLVLQGMDAAGKDGTIRSIFSGVNPAGVKITGFGVPAGAEAKHDFLWRIHQAAPAKGEIGVFNRSHYEDVLVVRVKNFVPKSVWSKRYHQITELERLLAESGTTIVKCMLHVGLEAQRKRLQDRIDNPEKSWKFRAGDLEDRKLWPQFQQAYEDALNKTSTSWAPWHVVPSDRNWVRNLVVAKLLLSALERIDPKLPPEDPAITGITVV